MPVFKPGLQPPFSGHGFYLYDLVKLLNCYGSTRALLNELTRLKVDHLWLRIHGRNYIGSQPTTDLTRETAFADSARSAGLAVAGWGWCQGEDISKEITLARDAIDVYAIDHYIADIEQGENGSNWTKEEVKHFLDGVAEQAKGLAVTSFGFIDGHSPDLLQAAGSFVDMINPQAYWYANYPTSSMLSQTGNIGRYPLANSAGYASFCRDRYEHWAAKPVVVTGQAFSEDGFTNDDALAKLEEFFTDFHRYNEIHGLNWWHLGSANQAMRDVIAANM